MQKLWMVCYSYPIGTPDWKLQTNFQNEKYLTLSPLQFQVYTCGSHFKTRFKLDQLELKGEKEISSVAVAVCCGGMNYGSSSIKHPALTTMRPPASVIKLVQDLANQEDPLTWFTNERLNGIDDKTVDDMVILVHCRPFFTNFHMSSLKSATLFMRGVHVHGQKAQLQTIHRYASIT